MSYKITPKISETSSRLLDSGELVGAQALNYNPLTGDFDLSETSSSGDFINESIVYVDPNGDDATGEMGNKLKPFATPIAALYAAAEYMLITVATGPDNFSDWARVTIEIFPGFYTAAHDIQWITTNLGKEILAGSPVNLMYNFINWFCHPGAVMFNYSFRDDFNYFNLDTLPVTTNVNGHGTWLDSDVFGMLLTLDGSILKFHTSDQSSLQYYVSGDSTLKYSVNRFLIIPRGNTVGSGQEKGDVTLLANKIIWRTIDTVGVSFWALYYQGGGKFNMYAKEYFRSNVGSNVDSTLPGTAGTGGSPSLEAGGRVGQNYELLALSLGYWEDYEVGQNYKLPAPSLGYWEEFDSNFPTVTSIRIDNAIFGQEQTSYIMNVDGGDISLYPGNIEVRGISADIQSCIGFYLGGPYYTGAPSKFSIYGGKITFNAEYNPFGTTKGYGLYIYDDPQTYVYGTQFKFNENFNSQVIGVYLGGPFPSTYQDRATILDSTKFFSSITGPSASINYTFAVDGVANADIKIYGNCFSNFNPIGSSGGSVANLIPGTSMIIDSNIQII